MEARQGPQALENAGREEVEDTVLSGQVVSLGEGGEGGWREGADVRLGVDHIEAHRGVRDY